MTDHIYNKKNKVSEAMAKDRLLDSLS